MTEAQRPDDYERSDVDPRLIAALAVGLAAFLAVSPLALRALYPLSSREAGVPPDLPQPPPPRLEVHPRASLAALHAQENALLNSYGWADREHQVARIPIGQAMRLLAERGLPGWPSRPAAR